MYLIGASWLEWLTKPENWLVIAQVAGGLGFVIFVHELGHFLVAKACGVKCEKFYLGFDIYGLKLLKFRAGETEYGIGILPLGGYVKMLGQDDNPAAQAREAERSRSKTGELTEEEIPHGDIPAEPTLEHPAPHDPRSYLAKSVPQRMAIISAGVTMNVIFAFLMATVAYMMGVKEYPCIAGATSPGSAAWRAGIRTGDDFVTLGDEKNPTFGDVQQGIPVSDLKKGIPVEVRRPGVSELLHETLYPTKEIGVPKIGMSNYPILTLGRELPTERYSAASQAKPPLEGGDRIVKVDGTAVKNYREFASVMLSKIDEPVKFTVERIGKDGDGKPIEGADPQQLDVDVPPAPMKTTGLVMKMGPIAGIQAHSPASNLGFEIGDVIVKLNGEPIGDPMLLPEKARKLGVGTAQVTVSRFEGEKEVEKTFDIPARKAEWVEIPIGPGSLTGITEWGIAYKVLNEVASVEPNSPAAKAGIKVGQKLATVTFVPTEQQVKDEGARKSEPIRLDKLSNWAAVSEQANGWAGKLQFEVVDTDGNIGPVDVTPVPWVGHNQFDRGLVLAPDTFILQGDSIGDSARLGYRKTVSSLLLVYRFLDKLSSGQISPRLIGGPLAIAGAAADQAKQGMSSFLIFLTMLSANLAVINFLPIPVLDGGHMVFLGLEGIRRKPVSERIVLAFHYAGFVFLVSLMLFVLSLDLGLISRVAQ